VPKAQLRSNRVVRRFRRDTEAEELTGIWCFTLKRGFAFDWDLDKKKDAESNVEVYVGKSDPRRSVTHRLFYVVSL
jgi:hypothetical protein